MITKRSIPLCIILSIVTCGIYGIIWLYQMAEDINTISGENSASGGMVVLLSIVTCSIYTWYWLYKCGEKIDMAKQTKGIPSGNSGILYLLLGIFGLGIVSYALIQDELNKIADD